MGDYYGVSFSSQKNDLSHYGIKGQKWGVRRFQYENGSYTPEGRERYGKGTGKSGALSSDIAPRGLFDIFSKKSNKVKLQDLQGEVAQEIQQNHELIDQLHHKEDAFVKDVDEVYKEYKKFFENKKQLTKSERDAVWEKLHEDFGEEGPDDEDFFRDEVIENLRYTPLWDSAPKDLMQKRKRLEEEAKSIASDVEKLASTVIEKHKDQKVTYNNSAVDVDTKTLIKEIMRDNALKNQWIGINLFIGPYTSDWDFYDSREYWNAVFRFADEFTVKEYEKRQKSKQFQRSAAFMEQQRLIQEQLQQQQQRLIQEQLQQQQQREMLNHLHNTHW